MTEELEEEELSDGSLSVSGKTMLGSESDILLPCLALSDKCVLMMVSEIRDTISLVSSVSG